MTTATLPELISNAQTTEESFLRHIFVRDQIAEWTKTPLGIAKADGVNYWDVHGKRCSSSSRSTCSRSCTSRR